MASDGSPQEQVQKQSNQTEFDSKEGIQPILSLRNVSKNFGAVAALTNIDLDVYPGEVVALVGDNGAGKSTLIKILAGAHALSSGAIAFEGKDVEFKKPSDALELELRLFSKI